MIQAESLVESRYAWARLWAALALMTIGGSGMYAITVVLPRLQTDFGVDRAAASLPYTFTMIGFGLGGILMGRLSDRFGVMVPVIIGALGLSAGFVAAGTAGTQPLGLLQEVLRRAVVAPCLAMLVLILRVKVLHLPARVVQTIQPHHPSTSSTGHPRAIPAPFAGPSVPSVSRVASK